MAATNRDVRWNNTGAAAGNLSKGQRRFSLLTGSAPTAASVYYGYMKNADVANTAVPAFRKWAAAAALARSNKPERFTNPAITPKWQAAVAAEPGLKAVLIAALNVLNDV
jgi:hypothetical protein